MTAAEIAAELNSLRADIARDYMHDHRALPYCATEKGRLTVEGRLSTHEKRIAALDKALDILTGKKLVDKP